MYEQQKVVYADLDIRVSEEMERNETGEVQLLQMHGQEFEF